MSPPISLADSSITSSTPGVLVKGTVRPYFEIDDQGVLLSVTVVASDRFPNAIADQIDTQYIVNSDTAYWSHFSLETGGGSYFYS